MGLRTVAQAADLGEAGMEEEIFAIMAPNSEDAITKNMPTFLLDTENAMITENMFLYFFFYIFQCQGCFLGT